MKMKTDMRGGQSLRKGQRKEKKERRLINGVGRVDIKDGERGKKK